jgi:hypothetical protein
VRVFECPNAGSSCPFLKKMLCTTKQQRRVLISLARNENELTRDMFMARVRAPHPDARCLVGTVGGRRAIGTSFEH